jgi:long-subunit fatty acid transport protein
MLAACAARAQELEISVSPSPVGSGARAAGMADAFLAIADDATAASWNPAGLVQLERPEIAVVGAWNSISETFSADWHDEFDSRHGQNNTDLNFLSVTWPLPFLVADRNVVVGLYYQHKYDFSRHFNFKYNRSGVSGMGSVINEFIDFEFTQDGSLSAITPAVAFEVTRRLSLGIGVNLWRSSLLADNGWTQRRKVTNFIQAGSDFTYAVQNVRDRYEDVEGENYTLGLLWNPTDRWSLGVRYDTAWTASSRFTSTGHDIQIHTYAGLPADFSVYPVGIKERRTLRFPATLSFGAARRFSDRFTLALDASRTDWNDFWFKGSDGQRRSLVSAANLDAVLFAPKFDPTWTVRLGGEYVFIPRQPDETLDRIWSLRAGVAYDEEPATDGPDPFYVGAVGVGLLAKNRVNIDLAWQVRYGRGVNVDFMRGIRGFEEDVLQHRVMLSTVIYF